MLCGSKNESIVGGNGSVSQTPQENRFYYFYFDASGAALYKFSCNYTERVIATNLRTDSVVVKGLFNVDPKSEPETSSSNCMFLCCLLCKKSNKKTELETFWRSHQYIVKLRRGHKCLKYHKCNGVRDAKDMEDCSR